MHDFLALDDFSRDHLLALLDAADALQDGRRVAAGALAGRTVLTLFPESSVRTRVTFETAVQQMGAAHVSLPPTALDGREPLADLAGYLGCWIDLLIARHPRLDLLRDLAAALAPPLINAMTRENHPCEILADLQALRRLRGDLTGLRYALLAPAGNIAHSWCAAARVLGLHLVQACPTEAQVAPARRGTSASGGVVDVTEDAAGAVRGADVVLTDAWPAAATPGHPDFDPAVRARFLPYQVTPELLALAAPGALLNPCPPVTRGNEVAAAAMDSGHFIGYGAKGSLLPTQQAVMLSCLDLL
jgi:ornithine carbamoyltransferase